MTQVMPAGPFYAAEHHHPNDSLTNPVRYRYYRFSGGRDARLAQLWGKKG